LDIWRQWKFHQSCRPNFPAFLDANQSLNFHFLNPVSGTSNFLEGSNYSFHNELAINDPYDGA
jgi:hypothetical protein